jgi:O-succinylbenzoic acid--CoA ligase
LSAINLTTVTSRPLHAVLLPQEAAAGAMLDALAAAIDGTGPAIMPLDPALPRSRLNELIEAFAPTSSETAEGRQRLAPARPGGIAGPGVAEDVAVVLATSGSTGPPKGAELSAASLLASARASLDRLGAEAGQRWLCCLPVHHISGLGVLVRSLVSGSMPRVAARLDADELARAVADGCRYASLVPTQLRRLLEASPAGASPPVGELHAILLGGAAIPVGLTAAASAAGARVVTTYGMTETCGGCVYDGVPLDGVRVASRSDGRVKVAGPVLFSGYRLASDLTRSVFEDGWFITSDLGGPGPDGRLVLRGRADDVINSGGEKVVAAEVEAAVRGCQGVRDAVVVGIADPEWGERVTALVVPADLAAPPSLEQLRRQVRGLLPRYAAPQAVVHVAEIPMLASGKPDRLLLRQIATESAG